MTDAGWRAWVLTLFPEMFPGPLGHSLAGKAAAKSLWQLETINIRDFAPDKHGTVDDTPAGGGPGMVMRPDVLDAAIGHAAGAVEAAFGPRTSLRGVDGDVPLIYLSPRGQRLDHALVRSLAGKPGIVLICGRFEGVDQRVLEARQVAEVSLGDFVLSGGEPAALALLDAVLRLRPGIVGDPAALEEESFAQGLLEYPHYTRPRTWRGRAIPEVLLSGHHGRVRDWRLAQAKELTKARRPDLWAQYLGPDAE